MDAPAPLEAPASSRGRFRVAVIAASVVAAVVGSLLLLMRDSGAKTTTDGITATLPVRGHPGSVVAGPDALWVAVSGDSQKAAGDWSLLRLDPGTGAVVRPVYVGREVSSLARAGDRLLASMGGGGELDVFGWRSGGELDRHSYEGGHLGQIVLRGDDLWALQEPGRLLQLHSRTLDWASAPLRLSPGRTLALASGDRFLWATAADAGEVLRIDPATRAIKRVHVGGSPIGIVLSHGSVWVADRERGQVVRLDPRSLRPLGDPIRVGTKPSWLAPAGDSLFVTDQDDGTVARIDLRSGQKIGLPIRIAAPSRDAVAPSIAPDGQSAWVSSFASSTLTRLSPLAGGGKVTVRITGANEGHKGDEVTDGGVAGVGRFVASGAFSDQGKAIVHRTVRLPLITLRYVTVGKKGTVTYLIKVDTRVVGISRWTITSGTKAYKGLQGEGIERENADFSVFTLTGTVSR